MNTLLSLFLDAFFTKNPTRRHKSTSLISRYPKKTLESHKYESSGQGKKKDGKRRKERTTYSAPCQLPSPLIASACTLVMRSRFSVSDRLAESCASCECKWLYFNTLAIISSITDNNPPPLYFPQNITRYGKKEKKKDVPVAATSSARRRRRRRLLPPPCWAGLPRRRYFSSP